MKAAVIYWSGTGNTEQMAAAVAEGANAELFSVSEFSGKLSDYDRLAFGCSAMGAEELEESEFEPFFAEAESGLNGKTIALFGSYGWGDGEWMRTWAADMESVGARVFGGEEAICQEAPDENAQEACIDLGRDLAKA